VRRNTIQSRITLLWVRKERILRMENEFARDTNSESSARLWALEPMVRRLAEADPRFANAFQSDPLNAIRTHFGDAVIPNEGEYLRPLPDGGFELVFPKTNAAWQFAPPLDELPDELLEFAGGTSSSGCNGPSLPGVGTKT